MILIGFTVVADNVGIGNDHFPLNAIYTCYKLTMLVKPVYARHRQPIITIPRSLGCLEM